MTTLADIDRDRAAESAQGLIDRLDAAIAGIQGLTGQGEDYIWRPANKAWEAMVEARDVLILARHIAGLQHAPGMPLVRQIETIEGERQEYEQSLRAVEITLGLGEPEPEDYAPDVVQRAKDWRAAADANRDALTRMDLWSLWELASSWRAASDRINAELSEWESQGDPDRDYAAAEADTLRMCADKLDALTDPNNPPPGHEIKAKWLGARLRLAEADRLRKEREDDDPYSAFAFRGGNP